MPCGTLCVAKSKSVPAAAAFTANCTVLCLFLFPSSPLLFQTLEGIYIKSAYIVTKNLILFQSVYDFTPDKAASQIYFNRYLERDGFKTLKAV